jgi:hypothetical protein
MLEGYTLTDQHVGRKCRKCRDSEKSDGSFSLASKAACRLALNGTLYLRRERTFQHFCPVEACSNALAIAKQTSHLGTLTRFNRGFFGCE